MSIPHVHLAVSKLVEHRARIAEHAHGVDVRSVLVVHLALCDRYIDKRGFVDSTHAQIAEQTGESERVVRRALATLEACGLWRTLTAGNQHRGTRRAPTFVTSCAQPTKQRPSSGSVLDEQQRPSGRATLMRTDSEHRPSDARASTVQRRSIDRPDGQPHKTYKNNLPATSAREAVDVSRPFLGGDDERKLNAALNYGADEAKKRLEAHLAIKHGAARHPESAEAARERAIEAQMYLARKWLLEGCRPYDVACAIAARAAGEANARPPTKSELGLDNA